MINGLLVAVCVAWLFTSLNMQTRINIERNRKGTKIKFDIRKLCPECRYRITKKQRINVIENYKTVEQSDKRLLMLTLNLRNTVNDNLKDMIRTLNESRKTFTLWCWRVKERVFIWMDLNDYLVWFQILM